MPIKAKKWAQDRYGAHMLPLDVGTLPLPKAWLEDPAVLKFIALADATSRAEKISDPSTWTDAEREAYDAGDTVSFSRLRGYTEDEIHEFQAFIKGVREVDGKYGPDTAISICFEIDQQTKPAGL